MLEVLLVETTVLETHKKVGKAHFNSKLMFNPVNVIATSQQAGLKKAGLPSCNMLKSRSELFSTIN